MLPCVLLIGSMKSVRWMNNIGHVFTLSPEIHLKQPYQMQQTISGQLSQFLARAISMPNGFGNFLISSKLQRRVNVTLLSHVI